MLVIWSTTALAQVVVQLSADSTQLDVGAPTWLHAAIRLDADVQLGQPLWPAANDTFEFVAFGNWDTVATGVIAVSARLIAWDTGRIAIPGVGIPFRQGQFVDTAWSNPLFLDVGFPADSLTLMDIHDVIYEPVRLTDYWPHALAVAALLLAALVVWWWRRPVREPEPAPAPPPPPPHEVAFQRLDALRKQQLWQRGLIKEYHSELTHILRQYLERRFGVEALEATTSEIIAQMRQQSWPDHWHSELEYLLNMADMVKFAKAQPDISFHEEAMQKVEAFIRQTMPAEAEASAAAAQQQASADVV